MTNNTPILLVVKWGNINLVMCVKQGLAGTSAVLDLVFCTGVNWEFGNYWMRVTATFHYHAVVAATLAPMILASHPFAYVFSLVFSNTFAGNCLDWLFILCSCLVDLASKTVTKKDAPVLSMQKFHPNMIWDPTYVANAGLPWMADGNDCCMTNTSSTRTKNRRKPYSHC